tara:strand:+ start:1123 stop:1749 length:627 start_codon:yes stop_codon:yes gene_type:complete
MKIVFYTGAGISYESGIPLFEDKKSIFSKYPLEKVATKDGWKQDWDLFENFWNELELSLKSPKLRPNKFHYFLSKWEKNNHDDFTIITTNIDDLHEKAGSSNIFHIHGNITEKRVLENGKTMPDCVLFGENKRHIKKCEDIIKEAKLFICVGSSFSTGDENLVYFAKNAGCRTIEINPKKTFLTGIFDISFRLHAHESIAELNKTYAA